MQIIPKLQCTRVIAVSLEALRLVSSGAAIVHGCSSCSIDGFLINVFENLLANLGEYSRRPTLGDVMC